MEIAGNVNSAAEATPALSADNAAAAATNETAGRQCRPFTEKCI
jgi:hypothetical protein